MTLDEAIEKSKETIFFTVRNAVSLLKK